MDDMISRQAAIDALERIFDRCEEIEAHLPEGDPDRVGYKMYPDWLTVWKYLHQLPSAQPERKTGRWIHDGYAFKDGIDWMHCSECGHKDSWSAATRTPFCAWCGARMEEPEDIPMEYFENGGR